MPACQNPRGCFLSSITSCPQSSPAQFPPHGRIFTSWEEPTICYIGSATAAEEAEVPAMESRGEAGSWGREETEERGGREGLLEARTTKTACHAIRDCLWVMLRDNGDVTT